MDNYQLYINGQWQASESSKTYLSTSPIDQRELARFPLATSGDVDKAVAAAVAAFPDWKATPAPARAEFLLKAADIIAERKEELAHCVSTEMGKVIAEAGGDVQEAVDFFGYIAGEGRRLFGQTTVSELPDKFAMTVRQPMGVAAIITPWNFPVAVPSWKMGAALVSGNTLVFKAARSAALCAAKFIETLHEAGFPRGVVNFVTGSGSVVGNALCTHPDIKVISFTGGTDTGKRVYTAGAGELKRVGLELGGKNPIIVMPDAKLDLAVEGALFGAFGTAGQRCTATSRLLVHESIYDELMAKLIPAAEALKVGDPNDPALDVGPVHSQDQEETILGYIEKGKAECELLTGGYKLTQAPLDQGHFIAPTIFLAEHGTIISKEEIFGPVLSVIKFKDYAEAVHIANDIDYGLSSSIYTQDVNLAFKAMTDLEAGITYVNAPTIGAEVHLPFGGIKATGNGHKEAGTAAIKEFTNLKTVYVDYSGQLQKAQIDVKPME